MNTNTSDNEECLKGLEAWRDLMQGHIDFLLEVKDAELDELYGSE